MSSKVKSTGSVLFYFAYVLIISLVSNLLYQRTMERLENDFGCSVIECYEHPEYIKEILEDLYGKSYITILEKITDELNEFDSDKSIFRIIQELKA